MDEKKTSKSDGENVKYEYNLFRSNLAQVCIYFLYI